jgi:hypothetical protein
LIVKFWFVEILVCHPQRMAVHAEIYLEFIFRQVSLVGVLLAGHMQRQI